VPVNVILLSCALLVGVVLVGYVARRSHTIQREAVEEEAEGARERLMPGGEGGSGYGGVGWEEEERRGRR
jgi:hypothetical protein